MNRLGLQLGSLLLRALCVSLCASWLIFSAAHAESLPPDEIEFRQALKDMSNDLRLMCVAAHPDDEDGATLAYYRYNHGVKTYALLGTRGEGGQNEIGPELYEDLAVIRTKEMMEAAKIEGAELHFLDMPEFGFSKTIEETLEKWGKEVLLEKMLRKIREIRPHVIITHHGRMKDHGHHQAIGWAVQEAFDKAADANAFPESGEPWQVQRLYIRDFTGESKDAVVVDINEKDELRGKTYAEIAADALRAHKSQGMEQFIEMLLSGEAKAYYDLVKEKKGLLSSVGSVLGIAKPQAEKLFGPLLEGIPFEANAAARAFVADSRPRAEMATDLVNFRKSINSKARKADQTLDSIYTPALEYAVRLATNNWYVVKWDDLIVTKDQELGFQKLVTDPQKSSSRISTSWLGVGSPPHPYPREISDSERTRIPKEIVQNADLSVQSSGIYTSWAHKLAGHSIPHARHVFEPAMFRYSMQCIETGLITDINSPNLGTDPTLLDFFDIAPPVLPEFLAAPYLIRQSQQKSIVVPVRLTNYTSGAHAQEVRFSAPEGWGISLHGPYGQGGPIGPGAEETSAAPSSPSNTLTFNAAFTQEDEQRSIELLLTAPDDVPAGSYALTAETEGLDFTPEAKVRVTETRPPMEFDDLLWIFNSGALETVGLIDSYDTTFHDVMNKLLVRHERISESGFTSENLKRFSTIIVDMRAYAKRPDLKANNVALLEWCKRGGTLIVNYHKTFDWSPDFAPYPISLSNNRVTREDAPVKMLVPEHPWFNTPNKITPEDWDGWRQERGLYFPQKWDDAYTPLIETTDPDEVIPPGSCLIADYGEGKYFYTSLVWYRQLRELHPGALKLFANMLAL